ncbi:alpha/beta hydrolase [Allomesorhizobium camelthorni]|uniref:Alpha/beta hydrolase n=1 Tax=Allomesorhizobium camelthorni TaxID=475069 RepID=A0A6G4W7X8_9HYPH|nr:alpha/beta hydrolase [Mesorhizobium camelthorni]NGO50862.1 alpha/beta hydrolase [Mesorhizobium camelthorni]
MAPDYRKLLDAEMWAFIDRIYGFYPPEAIDWPIGKNREVYDRMSRAFHAGRPAGVGAETTAIIAPTHRIPIRIYRSAAPDASAIVLYFHGGGFILGGLDSHDDICAELCAAAGYAVVSVDYRLAPEHTGTAAFDDAVAAFEWAAANYRQPIVVAGESAGGNLAACLAHHVRGHARAPIGHVLIYPSLGGDMTKGSYVTHAEAPLLTASDVEFYHDVRTGGADVSQDPRYTPLAASDFTGLPPTVIFTAECDPLSSDGESNRDRILAAGGRAHWSEEQGLVHGYLRARHMAGRASASFARIVEAVGVLGRGEWRY